MADYPTLEEFLLQTLPSHSAVALDPFCHSVSFVDNLKKKLSSKDISVHLLDTNPVDVLWTVGRPPLPTDPVRIHTLEYAGQSCLDKLESIRSRMKDAGADILLVSLLDEVRIIYPLERRPICCRLLGF